jgi:hypothetical protein
MTPLRQRMVEDMQLRGLSEKTQEAYVRAVRQLAEHYGKSPAQISEEELRQYFLRLASRYLRCGRWGGLLTLRLRSLDFPYCTIILGDEKPAGGRR